MSKLFQNSKTHLSQLMNTSSFHQNVSEGNKTLNAISSDPLLSEAFGKGSGCTRLNVSLPRGPPEVTLVEKLTGSLYWWVEQCVPTLQRECCRTL